MPLIHGKSEKSFDKNVSTEMGSGKPQKQALAIAYSIKRRMAKKKMADGGQVQPHNSTTQPSTESTRKFQIASAFGPKKAKGGMIENEDLNPFSEPEHEAKNEMMKQHRLSPYAQNHDDLEEPEEQTERVMPDEEDLPEGMFGNIARSMRMRKMADGGMIKGYPARVPDYVNDELESVDSDTKIHNFGTDNLTDIAHHPDDDFLSDEEDTPYFHPSEMDDDESSPERSRIISKIMRGIAKRHGI